MQGRADREGLYRLVKQGSDRHGLRFITSHHQPNPGGAQAGANDLEDLFKQAGSNWPPTVPRKILAIPQDAPDKTDQQH